MVDPNSTEAVTRRHLEAYARGDVAALMADYAEDAVLVTAAGGLRGIAAIEAMFTSLFANLLPPGQSTVTINQLVVEGDVALVDWIAQSPYLHVPTGFDTLFVRNGKIVGQTGAGTFNVLGAARS